MKYALAAVAAAGSLLAATATFAAGKQDFTVVNATGYVISELYVSPSDSSDWESDILGKDVLAEDEETEITFERSEDTCSWDLKVVYADDNSTAEWGKLNLCKISTVKLHYDRKNDVTRAEVE